MNSLEINAVGGDVIWLQEHMNVIISVIMEVCGLMDLKEPVKNISLKIRHVINTKNIC